jgi:hypothetical protein
MVAPVLRAYRRLRPAGTHAGQTTGQGDDPMSGQLTYLAAREHGADLRRSAQKARAASVDRSPRAAFDPTDAMRRTRRLTELRRRLRLA